MQQTDGLPRFVLFSRFFMSMLHAWGQDSDLDKLALNKLGLLKPTQPLTFGILSRGGHMSLLLPGWSTRYLQVSGKIILE